MVIMDVPKLYYIVCMCRNVRPACHCLGQFHCWIVEDGNDEREGKLEKAPSDTSLQNEKKSAVMMSSLNVDSIV